QQVLRELEAALLAMPEKRLVADTLATPAGEVCAVGALLRARHLETGMDQQAATAELLKYVDEEGYQDEYTEEIAADHGVPRLVAWKLVELNDMLLSFTYVNGVRHDYTPEERYEKVLSWVRARLKGSVGDE